MEDTKFKEAKSKYDNIKIPANLNTIIESAIKEDQVKTQKKHTLQAFRRTGVAAAAFVLVFVGSVNFSSAAAMAMYEVPILGDLARVVTFKEYKYSKPDLEVNVEVPKIENTGNEQLEERINTEIQNKIDETIKEGEKRIKEYNEAVLATGGTEADLHQADVYVTYTKTFSDEKYLSFYIDRLIGLASADTDRLYYNINLESGKHLTLGDVMGDSFAEMIDPEITRQIQQRIEKGDMFFGMTEEDKELGIPGFEGVTENTKFYINSSGNIVVCFDKYEIAPGAMGIPEFEIPKTE